MSTHKVIGNLLAVVGLALLAGAVAGQYVNDPGRAFGFKSINVIILANTALLLAVLAKLSDKK